MQTRREMTMTIHPTRVDPIIDIKDGRERRRERRERMRKNGK